MTCPNLDRTLAALHCNEPAEPDCPECARALADEARFVALVERGLAGVRPINPIAPLVMERIAAEPARPAARRRYRPARQGLWIPAAAAAALALSIAAAVALRRAPPDAEKPAPSARAEEPEPLLRRSVPEIARPMDLVPPPPEPPPAPEPPPPAPEEKPASPEPETPPPPPPRPTVAEAPRRVEIPAEVLAGAVSVEGRRAESLASGEDFRASGRTRLALPYATLDFEGGAAARFEAGGTLGLVLHEGEIRVEAAAAAPLELRLAVPVRSATSTGRFVAFARPDRIWVEEGAAVAAGKRLPEGSQFRLAGGKEPEPERRTLGGEKWRAARPRETVLWIPGLERGRPPRELRVQGLVELNGLRSVEVSNPFYFGEARIGHEENRLIVAGPDTHLRFRYLLRKPAPLLFQAGNITKRENFQIVFPDPVVDDWTTVTARLTELRVNPGGNRALVVEPGDVLSWIAWFVGRPGEAAEVHVRDIQVLEIVRPSK